MSVAKPPARASLRLTGRVWNRDHVPHYAAIELTGVDVRGNAWARWIEVEPQPLAPHLVCAVDVELPAYVARITTCRIHPMLLVGAELEILASDPMLLTSAELEQPPAGS